MARFIVRPLAEADLDDAARWYDEEQPGLSGRFLSDVDNTFARIRERPFQFPAVTNAARRALLHTFPYAVYFRALDEAVVDRRAALEAKSQDLAGESSTIGAIAL
jgi:plasmid stabilization system protein ParE